LQLTLYWQKIIPVKNIFFLFISCYAVNCFAQETAERKNRLSDSVIERFYILKSSPEVKDGPYKAIFRRKIVIASGNYTKGKKTGVWEFYDTDGKRSQTFNYDDNSFSYVARLDTNDDLRFLFDEKFKKDDTVTRPLKIGEPYYGYIPFVTIFRLPFDSYDVNTDTFEAEIELLISPMGRLAEYKVHLVSQYYQYDHTISLDVNLFSEEERSFMPATLNHKRILSRVFIKCFVTSHGLDFL
jgi:hypothetical protein